MREGGGKLDVLDRGWSFSMGKNIIKITTVDRIFVLSGCVEAGSHSFIRLCFARQVGSPLSDFSVMEHNFQPFVPSLARATHPNPTLPQQPPAFHVSLDTDTYHRLDRPFLVVAFFHPPPLWSPS